MIETISIARRMQIPHRLLVVLRRIERELDLREAHLLNIRGAPE